ncbi:RNase adapter RapZ [Kiloniella laminariae]|uniref:RNase adapter RapZ n=1 Tax=Kiloniella laminariae TaxID=454162 RepID=UPI00037CEC6E|nr:RNase adapter RapZ [Kiloniella laminariae]
MPDNNNVQTKDPLRVVLVTGLSGAGRSTAMKVLEDHGFEAIDNLPLDLLDVVIGDKRRQRPLAVGIDIRSRNFSASPLLQHIEKLHNDAELDVSLVFLDCSVDVLERRFKETRRRHPLAADRPLKDGILAERRLVAPLQARANYVIDSSDTTTADFRQNLTALLGLEESGIMTIQVMSFSYRFGVPREADLMFDVRFLRNPHYDPDLRRLTGRDKAVADYVREDPDYAEFAESLKKLLLPLLPRYQQEGKNYLTIAIGCTGGRHRSVALTEWLGRHLGKIWSQVIIAHRDIDREPDRYR